MVGIKRARLLYYTKRVPIVGVTSIFVVFVCQQLRGPSRAANAQVPPLWSRQSLFSCVSRKCLHSPPLASQGLSLSDASNAHEHIHSYLSLRPEQPPPTPVHFLQVAARSTCSVVGGAPLPKDVSTQEQSRIVDDNSQITIRLNVRAPELLIAEGSAPPLGTRTDVLFLQRGSLHTFERYIHGWGEGNNTLGDARREAGKRLLEQRNPVLIYRPECPSRFSSCPMAWEALNKASLLRWTDVHLLHYDTEILTNSLLHRFTGRRRFRIGADVPSTGIVTIVAALRMCAKVHAFAMNGSLTGDANHAGQTVWRGHKLRTERRLLRWLETCPTQEPEGLCGKLTIYS